MGMRLGLLALVVVAGCGGSKKAPTDPGSGSGSGSVIDPGVIARTLIGWGRQATSGTKLNLFLEVADHTGAVKSYPLGTVVGPCDVVAGADDIVTTLRCVTAGVGSEYRAVYRTDVIVLRRAVDPSDDPNDVELLFQEVLRVDVPAGSKVGAAE